MDKEKDKLSAFSNQVVSESVRGVEEYLKKTEGYNFNIQSLILLINPYLVEGLEEILDKQAEYNIDSTSSDEQISIITENIYGNVSKWDSNLKWVLDLVLCKKILENKTIYDGNKNVTEELLKKDFLQRHTDDLLYINLACERDILKYKPQVE